MTQTWLIGAGLMAQEYIKTLNALGNDFSVIARGSENAQKCAELTSSKIFNGGLNRFLESKPECATHAIITVGVEKLFETTKELLHYGVKHILVEKPAALYKEQLEELIELKNKKDANVFIAYNRRFYTSVLEAERLIKQDGGIISANFEFTEWSHIIEKLDKPVEVKNNWFFANSTHVVDLAFFFIGLPKDISSFTKGKLDWHPKASSFAGAGVTEKDILFSYHADWESAGRWSLELLTSKRKIIFRPMEKLTVQLKGTVKEEVVELNYEPDEKFKPGLFNQVQSFFASEYSRNCTLEEQLKLYNVYNKILGE